MQQSRSKVYFSNGAEISQGETQGEDREAIFEAQVRYAVEEHFRRQTQVRQYGIKVLFLFFIDRVANYRTESGDDGPICEMFNHTFEELKSRSPWKADWEGFSPEQVRAAYFAKRRKRGGEEIFEDSVSGAAQKDEEAYNLIMKAKERLLSFGEPVAFIFSHSALREGWDNPNVFQICTLNQTVSDIKKRQEVGRGVRLPVDQDGNRVMDQTINVLTVVANESYEKYVAAYQQEVEDEYGPDGVPPKPGNARQKRKVKLRKERLQDKEFQALWESIKHKTRYSVNIDTERLITEVVKELDQVEIGVPRIAVNLAQVDVNEDERFAALFAGRGSHIASVQQQALPNVLSMMAHLMEYTSPRVSLTRRTLLKIFQGLGNKKAAIDNPQEFASTAVRIIKQKLAEQLVHGIRYEKIHDWYDMTKFDDFESWEDRLVPAKRSIYDHVTYESDVEKRAIKVLERAKTVKHFVKLPDWFRVATPVGDYNPDWAIVMEDRDEHGQPTGNPLLCMVRETKGAVDPQNLRGKEWQKILCGKAHFSDALGVDFRAVDKVEDLLNI
jgi:type III restriction enzyme